MRISDWSSDVCSSDLTRAQGIDPMPHQREALDRARDALDAIRPQGSTDLNSAFRNDPELVREAAEGRGHEAVRAMQVEAEIRSEEQTSELQSLMRISYAVFCLKKKKKRDTDNMSE